MKKAILASIAIFLLSSCETLRIEHEIGDDGRGSLHNMNFYFQPFPWLTIRQRIANPYFIKKDFEKHLPHYSESSLHYEF